MTLSIENLRGNLLNGGSRNTLFEVHIVNPIAPDGLATAKFAFTCRAASLPGSNVGLIEIPYKGRKLKTAGDRVFDEWTCTIINDEDFLVRNNMEKWSSAINSHVGNLRARSAATVSLGGYKAQAEIFQQDRGGAIIKTYKMVGLYPQSISPIENDWGANDAIQEFQVTFAYDYWTSDTTDSA